ncbi:MAG: hypothetical protein AAB368_09380 [bacterium]
MPHRPGHYESDRAGDLQIQREAQDFDRRMTRHRRETPPAPGARLGRRRHALAPLARVAVRGQATIRAARGRR